VLHSVLLLTIVKLWLVGYSAELPEAAPAATSLRLDIAASLAGCGVQ